MSIDGSLHSSASNLQNYINASYALGAGTHTIVFKVFDANGHIVKASKTVTVQ